MLDRRAILKQYNLYEEEITKSEIIERFQSKIVRGVVNSLFSKLTTLLDLNVFERERDTEK